MGEPIAGLAALSAERLPFNRKERYYTGTVLPAIVCCDEFAHFGRFLKLCGLLEVEVATDPACTNLQFFTEYGFKESLVDNAKSRFPYDGGKETPDVVVYIEGNPAVLLGIEAKVFSNASVGKINQQLQLQAELLSFIAHHLPTRPKVFQVALLPSKLGADEKIAEARVVSWERLADTFRDVAPAYWIAVLDQAFQRYDNLVSRATAGGQNNDDRLLGAMILERWQSGDREFPTMGRGGGLGGAKLREDIQSGGWRDCLYEVSRSRIAANSNWFPVESFVAALNDKSQIAADRVSEWESDTANARASPPPTKAKSWAGVGKNADAKISGQEIYDRYTAGDMTFTWMGRNRGRDGPELLNDLRTGHWRTQFYEVRHERIHNNRNWFPIKSFIEGINLRQPQGRP